MLNCKPAKSIINNSRSDWFSKANKLVWAEPCARWAELKMLSFWAGGISSFSPCARKYRLLRRLRFALILKRKNRIIFKFLPIPQAWRMAIPPCYGRSTPSDFESHPHFSLAGSCFHDGCFLSANENGGCDSKSERVERP